MSRTSQREQTALASSANSDSSSTQPSARSLSWKAMSKHSPRSRQEAAGSDLLRVKEGITPPSC